MKRILVLVVAAVLAAGASTAAVAQTAPTPAPGPQTYDMRDDASPWINDPHLHQFYQMTIDAFAHGPDRLDRAAFNKRFREIFTDFALSRHVPPKRMLDHVKRIPGEMILIVTRDPHTLDSYDSFVVALFGPQNTGPGAGPG